MGGSSRNSTFTAEVGFLIGVTGGRTIPPLNSTTEKPVRVEQWPLSKEKLHALETLVEEQLSKGHVVPSDSPWNFPVFVIRKSSGGWSLLHDLREINKVIVEMGPLQPGLPSPVMIPRCWPLAVIDIKDCFFSIPLHPRDVPRFAFSIPSTNREAPMKRYHWTVLPQGMRNSPVLCQWYVSEVLSPTRKAHPKAIIYHYMDDLLISAPHADTLEKVLQETIKTIQSAGMEINPDKIQRTSPWSYLGVRISERTITPQQLVIQDNPQTLRDLHQLCGAINWVRPLLGLTNEDLAPLFHLLKGGEGLDSPRNITPDARKAIDKVQLALSSRQAHQVSPSLPFRHIILGQTPRYHALIFQWDVGSKEPLLIIEWVFLPH